MCRFSLLYPKSELESVFWYFATLTPRVWVKDQVSVMEIRVGELEGLLLYTWTSPYRLSSYPSTHVSPPVRGVPYTNHSVPLTQGWVEVTKIVQESFQVFDLRTLQLLQKVDGLNQRTVSVLRHPLPSPCLRLDLVPCRPSFLLPWTVAPGTRSVDYWSPLCTGRPHSLI